MRTSGPPHYLAFRAALVLGVLITLALAAWWMAQPQMLRPLLTYLHIRVR